MWEWINVRVKGVEKHRIDVSVEIEIDIGGRMVGVGSEMEVVVRSEMEVEFCTGEHV